MIKTYKSEKAMERGIKKLEKKGWIVRSVDTVDPGYGCLKTGCLGVLFLPLALLGKKPKYFRVVFQKAGK